MRTNVQNILEEVKRVSNILQETKGSCYVSLHLDDKGETTAEYSFWGLDREKALTVMRSMGIRRVRKAYRLGDVDWIHQNVTFNQISQCDIVGYKDEIVPEHIEKVPIYKCPDNDETVEVEA